MNFSEFINLLHPIIGGGSSTHAFARTMLEAIVSDGGLSVLEGYSRNTYKAYFNGRTKITNVARAVSPYIDPEEFISYLEQFPDPVALSLCSTFAPFLPGVDARNICAELADLFLRIIKGAASTKRKSAPKDAA